MLKLRSVRTESMSVLSCSQIADVGPGHDVEPAGALAHSTKSAQQHDPNARRVEGVDVPPSSSENQRKSKEDPSFTLIDHGAAPLAHGAGAPSAGSAHCGPDQQHVGAHTPSFTDPHAGHHGVATFGSSTAHNTGAFASSHPRMPSGQHTGGGMTPLRMLSPSPRGGGPGPMFSPRGFSGVQRQHIPSLSMKTTWENMSLDQRDVCRGKILRHWLTAASRIQYWRRRALNAESTWNRVETEIKSRANSGGGAGTKSSYKPQERAPSVLALTRPTRATMNVTQAMPLRSSASTFEKSTRETQSGAQQASSGSSTGGSNQKDKQARAASSEVRDRSHLTTALLHSEANIDAIMNHTAGKRQGTSSFNSHVRRSLHFDAGIVPQKDREDSLDRQERKTRLQSMVSAGQTEKEVKRKMTHHQTSADPTDALVTAIEEQTDAARRPYFPSRQTLSPKRCDFGVAAEKRLTMARKLRIKAKSHGMYSYGADGPLMSVSSSKNNVSFIGDDGTSDAAAEVVARSGDPNTVPGRTTGLFHLDVLNEFIESLNSDEVDNSLSQVSSLLIGKARQDIDAIKNIEGHHDLNKKELMAVIDAMRISSSKLVRHVENCRLWLDLRQQQMRSAQEHLIHLRRQLENLPETKSRLNEAQFREQEATRAVASMVDLLEQLNLHAREGLERAGVALSEDVAQNEKHIEVSAGSLAREARKATQVRVARRKYNEAVQMRIEQLGAYLGEYQILAGAVRPPNSVQGYAPPEKQIDETQAAIAHAAASPELRHHDALSHQMDHMRHHPELKTSAHRAYHNWRVAGSSRPK
ncbi:unnamed protein product [Amoebophrya sp. A25]|nr:unnamed protein product [Amoebophrya sp. A25]|eukprot:GSA25T00012196001.1